MRQDRQHRHVDSTNSGTDSDDASVTVECPDLVITKLADDGTVNAGEDIGFTITVHNNGPGAAHDVALSDPLPDASGLDWSIDGGTGAAQSRDRER